MSCWIFLRPSVVSRILLRRLHAEHSASHVRASTTSFYLSQQRLFCSHSNDDSRKTPKGGTPSYKKKVEDYRRKQQGTTTRKRTIPQKLPPRNDDENENKNSSSSDPKWPPTDPMDMDDDEYKKFINDGSKVYMSMAIFSFVLAFLTWLTNSAMYAPRRVSTLEGWNLIQNGEVQKIMAGREMFKESYNVVLLLYPGTVLSDKTEAYRVYFEVDDITAFEAELFKRQKHDWNIPPNEWQQVVMEHDSSPKALFYSMIGFGILFSILGIAAKKLPSRNILQGLQGTATFRPIKPDPKGPHLKDVVGLEGSKAEVQDFVDSLQHPLKYVRLGARAPRGAIMHGPPGVGKTMLAKALANESNVNFFNIPASSFSEIYGGVGARRMRGLFKSARRNAPCVVFIDEIDALGSRSEGQFAVRGSRDSEQTLNQMLVEMDGMEKRDNVFVLAATNKIDKIDSALLRPGRFDRKIELMLPNVTERQSLFVNYLSKLKLASDVAMDINRLSSVLAQSTHGCSPADIANICQEAAMHAGTRDSDDVEREDIDYGLERARYGALRSSNSASPAERTVLAHYLAGKVIAAWYLEHAMPPLRATMLPRTSGVYTTLIQAGSATDRFLKTEDQLNDETCVELAGRAAEMAVFKQSSTLPESDLKAITQRVYHQVDRFGFPGGPTENMSFDRHSPSMFGGEPFSKNLKAQIDMYVAGLLNQCHTRVSHLLTNRRRNLEILAKALIEKDTLTYSDFKEILDVPLHHVKYNVESLDLDDPVSPTKSN